jgi:predicted nicotinamide N-methyase
MFWRCRDATRIAARLLSTSTSHRSVAHIDGSPVLIHNLAKFYYDARPIEAIGSRDTGSLGDLTGFRVWEAAPQLIRYLDAHRAVVRERTVLELGAGTGSVGLSAAALGATRVVLSDADSTVTLEGANGWEERSRLASLAENAKLNGERAAAVSVTPLRWGNGEHIAELCASWPEGFETILGSDLLYSPRNYDALEVTIRALAAANVTIVLSFPIRHGEEESFIERLAEGEGLELIERDEPTDAAPPAGQTIRIVELSRTTAR